MNRIFHKKCLRRQTLQPTTLAIYFSGGCDVSDANVLIDVVAKVGLDLIEAKKIIEEKRNEEAVREIQVKWIGAGISGVPAVISNERNLVSGAQVRLTFEDIIPQILSQDAS